MMKSKKELRRKSRKNIQKVGKMFRNLPTIPESVTYMKLYQVLQELHFLEDYELANRICDALRNK